VWPGTESNYRHEDFQSSCRTETMCHCYRVIEHALSLIGTNIVSEDDLVEANEKVLGFLCEAIKENKIEKLKE